MIASPIATEPHYPSSSSDSQPETQDDVEKLFDIIVEGKCKKFICTLSDCQKVFRFHSEMQRHAASHSSFRPHRCTFDGCTKEFKRPSALENHIRSQHTGEAPLRCPHSNCGLRFSTEAKYRYHLVSHMDEKPYKCKYSGCNKGFMTLSQLKQHEKSPTVHKKVDVAYKLEEKEQKHDLLKLEIRDDVMRNEDVEFRLNMDATKKVKYDIQNRKLTQLLTSLQTLRRDDEMDIQTETKDTTKAPLLDHVIVQNEVLRKKLENSEQMLVLMKRQIEDINKKRVGSSQIATQSARPISINVKTPWIQAAESFLIHDPFAENMRSYLREEDLAMKTDFFSGGLKNEKLDFFIPNLHFEDFNCSPFRETI